MNRNDGPVCVLWNNLEYGPAANAAKAKLAALIAPDLSGTVQHAMWAEEHRSLGIPTIRAACKTVQNRLRPRPAVARGRQLVHSSIAKLAARAGCAKDIAGRIDHNATGRGVGIGRNIGETADYR